MTRWLRPAALLLVLAWASAARAQHLPLPVQVDGERVRVRAEAGLERWAERAAGRAPAALRAIYADLPDLPQPGLVEIRIVNDARDLARAAPPGRGAPPWADGVAYGDQAVVSVALWRGGQGIDFDRVLTHELAHLALDAALDDRAPRWLHEGFAYLHSSDWSWGRTNTLVGLAWSGDVIPLAELDRHFHGREDETGRAYAQSYDLVAFLTQRGRSAESGDDGDRWAFREFLQRLAIGESMDRAARASYHATLDQLYAEWYESLRQRYMILPIGLFSLGLWVLAAVLLVLAWLRRRRQNRQRLRDWARREAAEGESEDETGTEDGSEPEAHGLSAPSPREAGGGSGWGADPETEPETETDGEDDRPKRPEDLN